MPTLSPVSPEASRWCCQMHLRLWQTTFMEYFPRKAHLAGRAIASLCGVSHVDALEAVLPAECEQGPPPSDDALYVERRMERFREDRRVLIHQYRIKPSAADLFLTHSPVGCDRCYGPCDELAHFDQSRCYYADDEAPTSEVETVLVHQYNRALGCIYSHMQEADRLEGGYLPPRMYHQLFHHLAWNFTHDVSDDLQIRREIPLVRLGWIKDPEMGAIACYNIPTFLSPNSMRDELRMTLLYHFNNSQCLLNRPILLLFNKPLQYVTPEASFTSIGVFCNGPAFMHCFIPSQRMTLADVFVANRVFGPNTSPELVDHNQTMLSLFLGLLKGANSDSCDHTAWYEKRPDCWAVPFG